MSWSIRPTSSTSSDLRLRRITLAEMLRMPPIPSGFVTDRVLDLLPDRNGNGLRWRLEPRTLSAPLRKVYDMGKPQEMLAAYGEHPYDLQFVCAERGRMQVGWLVYKPQDWNDTIWLLDIRVREEVRGQGVGSALLTWLIAVAEDDARRGLLVETQTNNVPAIEFYERRGFHIAGFHECLYTDHDVRDGDVALFLFRPTGPHVDQGSTR